MVDLRSLRDAARLCAAADHRDRRRPDRRQAQPARVQSPVAPAARLFRAAPGRRDDVPDQPDQQGARVHDRQAADDVPRPDHAVRAAAVPVLAERDPGLDRAGLRRADHADHPGVPAAAARAVRARRRRRDLEVGDARRDHLRHQDGQGAGARTAAQGAVGRDASRMPASGGSPSPGWPTGRRPWSTRSSACGVAR